MNGLKTGVEPRGNDRAVAGAIMSSNIRQMRLALPYIAALVLLGLVACGDNGDGRLQYGRSDANGEREQTTRLIERDVETSEIFQMTEPGLWDRRPSLGGVWAAHPDTKDPERAIIRNDINGKFVVGTLFRRERETPGPELRVSSDAAKALGMLAGAAATLNVTALRREDVSSTLPPSTEPTQASAQRQMLATPEQMAAAPVEAPVNAAAIEIGQAETAVSPWNSSLSKPFLQIGIFSMQPNADNAVLSLREMGVVSTIQEQSTDGQTLYRVIGGRSATFDDQTAVLGKVKALGICRCLCRCELIA